MFRKSVPNSSILKPQSTTIFRTANELRILCSSKLISTFLTRWYPVNKDTYLTLKFVFNAIQNVGYVTIACFYSNEICEEDIRELHSILSQIVSKKTTHIIRFRIKLLVTTFGQLLY